MSPRTPDLQTLVYCDIHLPGGDKLNQQYVNLLGKDLNVTDVHFHVKVLHYKTPIFDNISYRYLHPKQKS